MFNISPGTILDVAIGMSVLYLMLSLIGAAINEFFAAIVKLRARTLSGALLSIVDDPRLRKDFYDSGVIAGAKDSIGGHPSYIASADFAHAIVNSLDPSKPFPVIADLRQSTLLMPDSNIRDVLLAQLAAAEGDMEALRNGLAQWFDSAMDRVSGVYTRYLKYIALGVGLAIAVCFNVDSVTVATRLWQDPALRAQMIATAKLMLDKDQKNVAVAAPATGGDAGAAPPIDKQFKALREQVETADAALKPLPIGWSNGMGRDPMLRIIGWILTGLAVSLGAPFWFDLLSKFMSIRAAGDKPARADDS